MPAIRSVLGLLVLLLLVVLLGACAAPAREAAAPPPAEDSPEVSAPDSSAPDSSAPDAPDLAKDVIMEDQFVDNRNGWPLSDDETTAATIAGGKLRVKTAAQSNWSFLKPSQAVSDIDLTVEAAFEEGNPENAGYGVLCRVQDAKNLVGFTVSPAGHYMIFKTVQDEPQVLIDWTESGAINTGAGAVNVLRVVCSGDHLQLYVNAVSLADLRDDTFAGGSFALQAGMGDLDEQPVAVTFGNLILRRPDVNVVEGGQGDPSAAAEPAEAAAPVLADAFDDNRNAWELYDESGGSAALEDGRLVMQLRKAELFWTRPGETYSDIDLTFSGAVVDGSAEAGAYGALCRYQDGGNYYVFLVSGGGQYGVYKSVEGEMEEIVGFGSSDAIRSGGEANRVRVVCSADDLRLYVNDVPLAEVKDDTFTDGAFMLVAQSFDKEGQPVTVAFDDLEVRIPAK